ncbi:MAG: hypothetical protein WBA12_14200, partial [Catalinimonas sp.]
VLVSEVQPATETDAANETDTTAEAPPQEEVATTEEIPLEAETDAADEAMPTDEEDAEEAPEDPYEAEVSFPLAKVREEARARFVGLKLGESIRFVPNEVFDPAEVAELLNETIAERGGESFELMELGITRHLPAALDQELFTAAFGLDDEGNPHVTDETAMRAKVREQMEGELAQTAEQLLRIQLRKAMLDQTIFPLPEDFLKSWLRRNNEQIDDETIEREFGDFLEGLRWDVISNRVAEDNNLVVTEEEVVMTAEENMRKLFRNLNLPVREDMARDLARRELTGEEARKYFRKYHDEAQQNKVANALLSQVTVLEETVDQKAFDRAIEEITKD